jgi:putative heme-binding domain-containing protein
MLRDILVRVSRDQIATTQVADLQLVEAIEMIGLQQSDADVALLSNLLDQQQPQRIQELVARTLVQYQSTEVAERLLERWQNLTPRIRLIAADVLLSRKVWIEIMIGRAGQGGFQWSDLDPSRLANLRNHPDVAIREAVMNAIQSSATGTRQESLQRYRACLSMVGTPINGKAIFVKSCSACHRLESAGFEIGPNIASYKFRGAEAILQNVIEPNREVNPQYVNYSIVTKDDRILTGMISNESESNITLQRGDNAFDTIARQDIAEIRTSKLSLMPEGLESQIDLQAMADLIAYIGSIP